MAEGINLKIIITPEAHSMMTTIMQWNEGSADRLLRNAVHRGPVEKNLQLNEQVNICVKFHAIQLIGNFKRIYFKISRALMSF